MQGKVQVRYQEEILTEKAIENWNGLLKVVVEPLSLEVFMKTGSGTWCCGPVDMAVFKGLTR